MVAVVGVFASRVVFRQACARPLVSTIDTCASTPVSVSEPEASTESGSPSTNEANEMG